jgi:hypothetical protein
MIKYYYNPEDKMVVVSDDRTFTIDCNGDIFEQVQEFKEFDSDIPCESLLEAFELLIADYSVLMNEELEFKRVKLVELENFQLKSLIRLRNEVEKYE